MNEVSIRVSYIFGNKQNSKKQQIQKEDITEAEELSTKRGQQ